MQLRTITKPKAQDKDLGYEQNPTQSSTKAQQNKAKSNDKNIHSSNEANSNESNEKELKRRHQLRNSSSNYQGKYKKMNSGKYLYKLSSSDKKQPIAKKRQLKHIPNELTNQLKKIILHLHKKEEEIFLNKKKKREEVGKKTKKPIRKPPNHLQTQHNMSQMVPFQSFNYFQGNLFENKSFQLPQHTMNTINGGYRFQNNGLFMLNNGNYNTDSMYPIHSIEPKEAFNASFLNHSIKKGTVNHIIGAFYILIAQQAKGKETTEIPKKVVKVNSVKIDELCEEKDSNQNVKEKKEGVIENSQINSIHPPDSILFSPRKSGNSKDEKNLFSLQNLSTASNSKEKEEIIKNKISEPLKDVNINIAGEQQLNTVNTVIKSIKENKMNHIIDEEKK